MVSNYREGGGGLQNRRGGGQVKFYPYGKGGGGKVLVYFFLVYSGQRILHVFISNYISYNSKEG